MNPRFPLKDVTIGIASVKKVVTTPFFTDGFYSMNQAEFSMDVQGVAWFYVSNGNFISIFPYPEATRTTIELYLNGSAFGAILYQRKILPMHGSCFRYHDEGIMICGEAGAGKSSLTASFCLNGADFLTDDISPIIVKEGKSYIWALSERIKLWGDTLEQLGRSEEGLQEILPGIGKYFYPVKGPDGGTFTLDQVYILEKGEGLVPEFTELTGSQKLIALRGEIYRQEYLKGMPENEAGYFLDIVNISNAVRVIRVSRPQATGVREMATAMMSWAMENGVWSQAR